MSITVPTRDRSQDDPVVNAVESRIRAFAGPDIDRTVAGKLLELCQGSSRLTTEQRTAVLVRFPVPEPLRVPGYVAGRSIGGRS